MTDLTLSTTLIQSNSHRLRRIQILAVCSSLAILGLLYGIVIHDIFISGWKASTPVYVPMILFPIWLPPLWAAWRLKEQVDIFTIKLGLALFSGWSLFAGTLFLFFAIAAANDSFDLFSLALVVISLLAMVAFVNCLNTYIRMTATDPDWQTLVIRLGAGGFAAVCVLAIIPNLVTRPIPNEASVVGSLRTITIAELEFAKAHPERGFARTLEDLGPASSDPQIDPTLASGQKSSYLFTLVPGDVDASGKTTRFSVLARPLKFKRDGDRSFYTDQSGLIRYTKENRHANANDSPLQ
jgi:hypothetical protein